MATYSVSINCGWPHAEFLNHGENEFPTYQAAVDYIEPEMERLYPGNWQRCALGNNCTQYQSCAFVRGNHNTLVLGLINTIYTAEERERREIHDLRRGIEERQARLKVLEAKYPDEVLTFHA